MHNKMKKHYPIRTEESATQPLTLICPCGYRSLDTKDFVPVNNPSVKGVTCEGALEYLFGSVLIMKNHEAEKKLI
jgi:hypothetical protein